jgi:hypothetical protein
VAIQDSKGFTNGSISSLATAQQSQLATGGLKAEQQVLILELGH